tara:strand:+ start:585 stop:758 length:174 start_codon:yes stop_codon:yes gene_type:complete
MDKTKEQDNSKDNIKKYVDQLNIVERLILKTAENQLDSSFDISKSIGFLEWSTNKIK